MTRKINPHEPAASFSLFVREHARVAYERLRSKCVNKSGHFAGMSLAHLAPARCL